MPYPPTLPPNNRANSTPDADNHPSDHNLTSNALSSIVNEMGNDPSSGGFANIQARLDDLDPRANPTTLPSFRWGLFNGFTDGNAFAHIDWPGPYPGVPTTGDVGNRDDVGVVCTGARGPGALITTNGGTFALGGFNASSALIKVWSVTGVEVKSLYVVFHFLVWGPRWSGAYNTGTDNT